jgi:NADH-quinone oxidoreductase subunit A
LGCERADAARVVRTGKGGLGVGLERYIVAGFVVFGSLFVVVALTSSWLLAPQRPYKEKNAIYECGVEPIGPPWVQFRAGYYVYALLYVIFDIETVFLYPWAVTFGRPGVSWFVFVEMVLFVAILVGGLAYAWKEGALKWR